MSNHGDGRLRASGQRMEESNDSADDPRNHEKRVNEASAEADAERLIEAWTCAPDDVPGGAYVELCLLIASKGEDWTPRAGDIYSRLSGSEVQSRGITSLSSSSALSIEEGTSYGRQRGSGRTQYSIPKHTFRRTFDRAAGWFSDRPWKTVREVMEEILPDREDIPAIAKMQGEVRGYLREQYADELASALKFRLKFRARSKIANEDKRGGRGDDDGGEPGATGGGTNGIEDREGTERGRDGGRGKERGGPIQEGTGGIGEGVTLSSGCLDRDTIPTPEAENRVSEAENPRLEASEGDNSHVFSGLLDKIGHGKLGLLDSESEEGSGGGRSSKSYLVTEMIGNYKQRDLLNEAVGKVPDQVQRQYRHAVIHLLHSAEIYGLHDFHRIHHETWIEELPGGWTLDEIEGGTSNLWDVDGSVIEALDDGRYHSGTGDQRGLTREYRIKPEWALRFQSVAGGADPNYKLHHEDKRHQGSAALDSRLRDPSGHRWGEEQELPDDAYSLVDGALRVLDDTEHPIDISTVQQTKVDYEEAVEWARARHEEKGTEETGKTKEKAEGRLHALSSALDIIERQAERIEDGVAHIQNAYEVQPISGRFSFRRGGPLGLPGAVKALAYDLPGVHNYDIKSSQTVGLRQLATELQELGWDVSTAPLDAYLDKGGKDWAAGEYDLPRSLVKRVEHAVKFGGVIPDSIAQAEHLKRETGHKPEIAQHVEEYYFTEEARNEALEKLQAIFEPQAEMIQSLARGLLEEYWDAHKQRGGRGKGWVMRNHAGITFCPYDYEEGHVRRSKAMAWYLQGLEASYVHATTILSNEYDYDVIANEHDGCITIGEVPEEAKARAQKLSGYHDAKLVEKAFEDEEDVRALCDRIDIDPPQHFEDTPCKSSQNQSRRDDESVETPKTALSTFPDGPEGRSSATTPATSSSSTRRRPRPAEGGGETTSESTNPPGTPDEDQKSAQSKRSGAETTTSTSADEEDVDEGRITDDGTRDRRGPPTGHGEAG